MRSSTIRNRLLKERGLVPVSGGKLRKVPVTQLDHLKTDKMRLIEIKYGKTIEEMLTSGTCREVEKRYGIDFTTVSRWINKLNIRYTPDNLPTCQDCIEMNTTCQVTGLCLVLKSANASQATMYAKAVEVLGDMEEPDAESGNCGGPAGVESAKHSANPR